MRAKLGKNISLYNFCIYLMALLLLLEWLRPLAVVTDTAKLYPFIVFISVYFILSFLQINRLLAASVKLIIIFSMLHSVYYEQATNEQSWIQYTLYELTSSVFLLMQANWMDISPFFRSFLFFILLWLMCYLIHYWMLVQRRILLFLIITVVYITVLDTFSPYAAKDAIIRTIIVGFLMVGLLQIQRLKESEQLPKKAGSFIKYATPLIGFIIISVAIGIAAPKAAPQWPDPVPYLKGYGEGGQENASGNNGVKKIGYGANDSRLGGPFISDDTVIFSAQIKNRHYWRVETKDFYTGKGWEVSNKPVEQSFDQENTVLSWYESAVETEHAEALIEMEKPYFHVTYPAGLTAIEANQDVFYSADPLSEKIYSLRGVSSVKLQNYKVEYEMPRFSVEGLKSVTAGDSLENDSSFLKTYTQLPDSLPSRVKELAHEITKNIDNRYDKVKAVESYFKQNMFIYDTTNVAIPGKNDDYVDQFLFETKTGYCDNFSTSMIVLLRSLDIPARWVKGYTEGSFESTVRIAENERIFTVTNNNAHSWVEVYFPNHGWVPFEPTAGFNNPYSFVAEATAGQTAESNVQEQQNRQTIEETATIEEEKETNEKTDNEKGSKDFHFPWKYVSVAAALLAVIGYILIILRVKWIPFIVIQRYKYRNDDEVYFKAFHALLKQLSRHGLPRDSNQTLREYAAYVDRFFHSTEMTDLTSSYERALYRKDNAAFEWRKSVELWENLIKRVPS